MKSSNFAISVLYTHQSDSNSGLAYKDELGCLAIFLSLQIAITPTAQPYVKKQKAGNLKING